MTSYECTLTLQVKSQSRDMSGTGVKKSGLSRRNRDGWQLCNDASCYPHPVHTLSHKGSKFTAQSILRRKGKRLIIKSAEYPLAPFPSVSRPKNNTQKLSGQFVRTNQSLPGH